MRAFTNTIFVGLFGLLWTANLSGAHDQKIPIGDGRVSGSPRAGFLFSCQQRFNPNAGGAHASGNWVEGQYWYPSRKPLVDGNVSWNGGGISVSLRNGTRTITSKNLPTHTTGTYPIRPGDDAYRYDRNPNAIRPQRITLHLPANPEIAPSPSCVPMGMIGISLTGGAIFNAVDARGKDAPAHEIQDHCSGHPERSGQYHYHGPSQCLKQQGADPRGHAGLIGYALDGFGIYGNRGAGGKHLTNRNLDECHGHTETVIWDGKAVKMYHYHMTDEYPYTVGCFRGSPVTSGMNAASIGPRPQRNGPPRDPRATLEHAAWELGVSVNRLRRAVGAPPPDFRRAARTLGISEQRIRAAMRGSRQKTTKRTCLLPQYPVRYAAKVAVSSTMARA